jgi:hypothetical protein
MSEFFDPPEEENSRERIRELASSMGNGKVYERWKDIDKQIRWLCRRSQSDWIAQAPQLLTEALVFLIKQTHRVGPDVAGPLLQEVSKRMVRQVRRKVKGLDPMQAEQVVLHVEESILVLLLSEESSRQADFLEIAFAKSVEQRTLNAIEKLKTSTLMGRRGEFHTTCEGTDVSKFESERPLLLVPDTGPDPLEIFLEAEDKARVAALIEKASEAVKDPRHLEAAVLHFCHRWPMESKRGLPDLVSHFNISARQIRKWIATALKEMREALGLFEPDALEEVAND